MSDNETITTSIARRIKIGKEAEYEEWVHKIITVGSKFPGYLGVSILKPSVGTHGEYVTLVKFDNYMNQRIWETSPERKLFLTELNDITEGKSKIIKVSGLESWFLLPEVPMSTPPNKHKMALVITIVVFFLVLIVNIIFKEFLNQLSLIPKVAFLSTIQVLLLTYIFMPIVTKILKNWLFPKKHDRIKTAADK